MISTNATYVAIRVTEAQALGPDFELTPKSSRGTSSGRGIQTRQDGRDVLETAEIRALNRGTQLF